MLMTGLTPVDTNDLNISKLIFQEKEQKWKS